MAITTKFLEDLGIEKDVAEKIFIARNEEIEKDKAKLTAVQAELKEKTEAFDTLNTEFEALKTTNASGEEWKSKYEALQADIDAKEAQAKADKILAEKTESINKRFEAVLGDKKFNHEAIRADYLKKFGDAIELEENKSKSDADIFRELTENDATAFEGVTVVKLAGGKPSASGKTYTSKDEIMAIKDSNERLNAIRENANLFRKE